MSSKQLSTMLFNAIHGKIKVSKAQQLSIIAALQAAVMNNE